MKKSEFKQELFNLFDSDIEDCNYDEKIALIEKYYLDFQKKNDDKRKCKNKGKPWSDYELTIILQSSPTVENCVKYAKLFERGYGSIEQIYRWASTPNAEVKRKRPNDAFVEQVKKIAKETGWRA